VSSRPAWLHNEILSQKKFCYHYAIIKKEEGKEHSGNMNSGKAKMRLDK
jgi:hypothetical protein